MGAGNYVDANGNRVNVGNFDAKGLNVNNNWDNNRNDNLGVASARQSLLYPDMEPAIRGLLSLSSRAYPPAEHSADLIDVRLESDIPLAVDGLHIFGEANEDAQQIEPNTR